jgi:hypothetical protein
MAVAQMLRITVLLHRLLVHQRRVKEVRILLFTIWAHLHMNMALGIFLTVILLIPLLQYDLFLDALPSFFGLAYI